MYALIAVAALRLLPGAAYLFTWPLLSGLLSYGLLTWRPDDAGKSAAAASLVLMLPALLLFMPLLLPLWHAFPARGVQPVLVIGLVAGALLPIIELILNAPSEHGGPSIAYESAEYLTSTCHL